jgi:hypothetical protein
MKKFLPVASEIVCRRFTRAAPSWAKLVHTGAADLGQRVAEVVGLWVGGGEGLASGFDLHGAVAAGGADEFLDAPAGARCGPGMAR